MKTRKLLAITHNARLPLWASLICMTLSVGAPSPALAESKDPAEGTIVLYSEASGTWYSGSPIVGRDRVVDSNGQNRLNPFVIGLCNAGAVELNVASFASSVDGVVSLKCGTVSDGYIHIRNRHQSSWEIQNLGGFFWDDDMVWATSRALIAPASVIDRPGSKRCYTTPIQVFRYVNGAMQLVKTINPTVLVSTNNKIVITSIPTTKSSC
jgi:hypothetical protein